MRGKYHLTMERGENLSPRRERLPREVWSLRA